MLLCLLVTLACIGAGVIISALTGYPLYQGLLVGWLCPSAVCMAVMLPRIVMGKRREAHARRLREQEEEPVVEYAQSCGPQKIQRFVNAIDFPYGTICIPFL